MAGVRIVHATERGVMYTLVDASRKYGREIDCFTCHRKHVFKTYHFQLDGNGAAIVSTEIVERLKALPPGHGFTISNEVTKPPKQKIGMNGQGDRPTVVRNAKLIEPH